jgi:glutathione S-transferase
MQQPPREPARLVTIAFSHYCEKARWALDRAGYPYREEVHVPLFHWLASLRAGGGRTVPVLLVDGHEALADSTDILHFLDREAPGRLFPADAASRSEAERLEDLFDRRLGPHGRRLLYFHLLPARDVSVRLFQAGGPAWEGRMAAHLFPAMRALMRRGMRIDARGAERSRKHVDDVFAQVGQRLADGRRYLLGDTFTAADLTFAALAAPVVVPPEYGVPLPSLEEIPPAAAAIVRGYRDTPAGRFALRLYAEDRRPTH